MTDTPKNKKLIHIEISENEMEATLSVNPMADVDPNIDLKKLKSELTTAGVTYGIDDSLLAKIATEKLYNEDFIIAKGITSVVGEDSKYEFFFETKPKEPRPVIKPDGSVDHYNLDTVEQIQLDDLLCRTTPPKKAVMGCTVKGRDLTARDGRNIPLTPDKNVRVSDDGLEFFAAVTGFPKLIGRKVSVSSQYVVEGNVDFHTGNIEFEGDVYVKGDILDGFTVKATGNIDVKGNIKNASVYAGGTVNVLGGIVAKDHGEVRADQNINAIFVEGATLHAGEIVEVKKAIMHSNVYAGRGIFCEGGKGIIVGGELTAGELVQAKEVGSEYATKTKIKIGFDMERKHELKDIGKEIEKDLENYNSLRANQQKLALQVKALSTQVPVPTGQLDQIKAIFGKVSMALKGVAEALREKNIHKELLKDMLERRISPRIMVSGYVYPGVSLLMNGSVYKVDTETKYSCIYEERTQVSIGKYFRINKDFFLENNPFAPKDGGKKIEDMPAVEALEE